MINALYGAITVDKEIGGYCVSNPPPDHVLDGCGAAHSGFELCKRLRFEAIKANKQAAVARTLLDRIEGRMKYVPEIAIEPELAVRRSTALPGSGFSP